MAQFFSPAFSDEQIDELNKPLARSAIKKRKGGGGRELSYIEGHNAIDTANRIFGYGNWGYHLDDLQQVVILDPLTGEGIGVEYRAIVTVQVRGALPMTDVGSQPVAAVSVEEQCWNRRFADAKYHKKPVDESPLNDFERKQARAVIMEAHEQAKKAAATDALKRALRAYGNQFGNSLYGPERPVQDAKSEQAGTTGHAASNVMPLRTVAEKLAKSKGQAIERGLVAASVWEPWKAEVLGAPVADAEMTEVQYGVIFNALKALQASAKKAS